MVHLQLLWNWDVLQLNVSQKTVEYFIKHKMLRKILPIDFTDDLNFLPWLVKGSLASKQRELQGGWVSMLWEGGIKWKYPPWKQAIYLFSETIFQGWHVFSRAPEIPLTLKFSRLTKFLHAISRWELMGIKKNVHVKYQPSWFNTKFYILGLSRTDNLFRRLSGLWKLFHRSPRISRFSQDCMNPVKTDFGD